MRVMVLVKATKTSEAGIMPSEKLLTEAAAQTRQPGTGDEQRRVSRELALERRYAGAKATLRFMAAYLPAATRGHHVVRIERSPSLHANHSALRASRSSCGFSTSDAGFGSHPRLIAKLATAVSARSRRGSGVGMLHRTAQRHSRGTDPRAGQLNPGRPHTSRPSGASSPGDQRTPRALARRNVTALLCLT
jgi:hypothetical protein